MSEGMSNRSKLIKNMRVPMYTIDLLGLVIHLLLSTLLDQYLDLINT